jgi:hypothetical protein
MLAKRWRSWLWALLAAALGAGLWFGYRLGRRALHEVNEWFDTAPGEWEEALVFAFLVGVIELSVAWTLRRHYQRVLKELGRGEDVQDLYAAGANTYIEKPQDFRRYVEVLRTIHRYWLDTAILPPAQG